jgi:hypothetical protein
MKLEMFSKMKPDYRNELVAVSIRREPGGCHPAVPPFQDNVKLDSDGYFKVNAEISI